MARWKKVKQQCHYVLPDGMVITRARNPEACKWHAGDDKCKGCVHYVSKTEKSVPK